MTKGKRRKKLQDARRKAKAVKMEGYKRQINEAPDERTKYGRRWHARRRGVPVTGRAGAEGVAWWNVPSAVRTYAEIQQAEYEARKAKREAEYLERAKREERILTLKMKRQTVIARRQPRRVAP
jgi:hypothetical protein